MINALQNMWANSTIPCSIILIPDTTHNNAVKATTVATIRPSGISVNSARTRPDPDFSQSTQAQQIAAIQGETLQVYTDGATGVDLVCAATWAIGDLIMANGSGQGITCTSTNYYVGRAQTAGTIGALCPVDVLIGYMA